jgi:hypothetical protein
MTSTAAIRRLGPWSIGPRLIGQICGVGGLAVALLPLFARTAPAADKEGLTAIELAVAGEWGLPNDGSSFGPTAALEFTPIPQWLEIEVGATALFSRNQTEWDTDVVFKKPFDLSPNVEFEPGIGPVWAHTNGGRGPTDSIAGEAVFEFIIWPTSERKVGWLLEPSYSYDFGTGQRSLGMGVGLLIEIP